MRRNVHSLFWAGRSILEEFTESLRGAGYDLKPVGNVTVSPGLRCPAFLEEVRRWGVLEVLWVRQEASIRHACSTLRADDVRLIWVHEGKLEEHDADAPPVFE